MCFQIRQKDHTKKYVTQRNDNTQILQVPDSRKLKTEDLEYNEPLQAMFVEDLTDLVVRFAEPRSLTLTQRSRKKKFSYLKLQKNRFKRCLRAVASEFEYIYLRICRIFGHELCSKLVKKKQVLIRVLNTILGTINLIKQISRYYIPDHAKTRVIIPRDSFIMSGPIIAVDNLCFGIAA